MVVTRVVVLFEGCALARAGHAPSPERASSHEVGLPTEAFAERRRLHAYRVSVCPLCRWPMKCAEAPSASTMGFARRRPPPHLSIRWVFLLRLQLLFRVSPGTAAAIGFPAGEPADKHVVRSFRGFRPFSVFPAAQSHSVRRFPTHRSCCALRVSHPLDALLPARPPGLVPSRSRSWGSLLEALFRARRRTPFPAPGPSWGSLPAPKSRSAPPGVLHIARSAPTIPGV
jgi:hypothetical protein